MIQVLVCIGFEKLTKKIINVMIKTEFQINRTCRYLIQPVHVIQELTNCTWWRGHIFLDKVMTPVLVLLRFMKLATDHSYAVSVYI
jgi:hypothetical protein